MTGLDGRQAASSLFVVKAGAMLCIVEQASAMVSLTVRCIYALGGLHLSHKPGRGGREEPMKIDLVWLGFMDVEMLCCSGHTARRDP